MRIYCIKVPLKMFPFVFKTWGTMMLHRGVECPCLGLRHFVVVHGDKDTKTYNRWNELKTKFPSFDYVEHVSLADSSSDDD